MLNNEVKDNNYFKDCYNPISYHSDKGDEFGRSSEKVKQLFNELERPGTTPERKEDIQTQIQQILGHYTGSQNKKL